MSKKFRSRTGMFVTVMVAMALAGTMTGGSNKAHAASTTPAKGGWTWCTDSVKNGCLEAVTTISPEGVSTTYTDRTQVPSDLNVSGTCTLNGGSGDFCNSNKFETTANNTCNQRADWAGGWTTPSVEMDISWPSKQGWSVKARFSTGDFRPAFLIGRGTRGTRISDDGDGTFTFELTTMIDTAYTGSIPSPKYSAPGQQIPDTESIADSAVDSVHVQLWPRDHLIKTSSSGAPAPCEWYPFSGAWAEANAQGFSWSYSSGSPALAGSGAPTAPNVLKFMAQAPHFKPRDGSKPLEVNPARVQVFLPTSYFTALGYATLDEFDASSYSVSTEDGQTATPTVTKRDDGLLINLGVSHYSAPNPTVTFKVKGAAVATTGSLPVTTPIPAAGASGLTMKKSATKSLSSIISYGGSGRKTWRATGGCTIRSSRLVAPKTSSTCTVVLTVKNSKGRTVVTKRATVKVN